MRNHLSATVFLALALFAPACGSGSGSTPQSTATVVVASDVPATTAANAAPETSLASPTTAAPEIPPTSSADTVAPTTSAPDGDFVEPVTFASPSGNILCNMDGEYTSCWIGDKEWDIEQPDDPWCEESDWGNAIDLSADGVMWPCYTDFWFDPGADVLEYGDALEVGEFRCESERTGVTCTNRSGNGFTLARAAADVF